MASGDALAVFTPLHGEPVVTLADQCVFGVRNGHPTLVFSGTADQEICFTSALPPNYAGGGVGVVTVWSFTSATSGSLRVQAAFELMNAALDMDADSFAAFQSGGGTAPATSGAHVVAVVSFTNGAQMDSVVAGALFRLKIRRDADGTSGTDDITTTAELVLVIVQEL